MNGFVFVHIYFNACYGFTSLPLFSFYTFPCEKYPIYKHLLPKKIFNVVYCVTSFPFFFLFARSCQFTCPLQCKPRRITESGTAPPTLVPGKNLNAHVRCPLTQMARVALCFLELPEGGGIERRENCPQPHVYRRINDSVFKKRNP